MAKEGKAEMDDGGDDRREMRDDRRATHADACGMVGSCALVPAPRHATPTWLSRGWHVVPRAVTQGPSRLRAQLTLCGRRVVHYPHFVKVTR